MKNIVLVVLASVAVATAAPDTSVRAFPRNTVFFELLGSGLNFSLNYERALTEQFAFRIGIGGYGFNTNNDPGFQWVPVVPITIHRFFGEGSTQFECGAGAIVHLTKYGWETMFPSLSDAKIKGTLSLGLRYHSEASNSIFGLRFTPVFDAQGIAPWFGFYLGWGF